MIPTLSWRPIGDAAASGRGSCWPWCRAGYAPGAALILLAWFKRTGLGAAGCPGCVVACGDDLSSCVRTMENMVRRLLIAAAVAAALFAARCTASTSHPAASLAPLPPDPHTAAALLKIATAFNHDYDTGDYGPVYARWDARSQAIITRADYINRHKDCPSGPQALSQTESVSPGRPDGAWLVHYEISGQPLTDDWFYVHRRWVFDLVLSNPDAVKLYRMSPGQYAVALGCNH
jgi:hypothetical protein